MMISELLGVDPFREQLLRHDAEHLGAEIVKCAEPLEGEPAFDPEMIEWIASQTHIASPQGMKDRTIERAVRIGLAHIDATFQGDHPKYGVGAYALPEHDGFPPTIVAAVDALTLWGINERAKQLLGYWLNHFVRDDGSIDYYGTSLSEYGQLLATVRRLVERSGDQNWFREYRPVAKKLADYVRAAIHIDSQIDMPKGVPEADEKEQEATYFHNSAWLVRGLRDWAALINSESTEGETAIREADQLQHILVSSIQETWPKEGWWLRPMREPESDGYFEAPKGTVTENRLGSYTNYRYWPELLGANVLPPDLTARVVDARLTGGGQYIGVTRFDEHLDDWPLMDYLNGLRQLGRMDDYRLCVWGHVCYHQAKGHMTAYEQVSFPPGRKKAEYCLPCQLVAVRAVAVRNDDL